jgi:hypothetical protein
MGFFLVLTLQCIFPIFDISRADEFLGLSVVNRDNQVHEFTVTAVSPDGTGTQTGQMSVAAGGQRAQLLRQILGTFGPPSTGWIRVDSTEPSCNGYLASGNDDMLDGADAPAGTSTTILIPNVSIFTGFVELNYVDTYLAIVDAGTGPAEVTAQLFGLDGAMQGSTIISVPAGGSRTLAVSEAFASVLPDNQTA